MQIKAAVTREANAAFVIEDVHIEAPRCDEILIKVLACGICHTDELARIQALPVPLPIVLGHEGCGIVEEVGADVREFKPGDRVAVSFGYCGTCAQCAAGNPTLCELFVKLNFGGVMTDNTSRLSQNGTPIASFFGQSTFATHAVVSERSAVKIPDDIPLEITGPLGCGIQTGAGAVLNRIKPRPGSAIVVFGCGSVGLSAVMAAKLSGCGMIIGVDVVPARLEMARELGATHVLNSAVTTDIAGEVRKLTGAGADFSVDSTGKSVCTRMALHSIRPGGAAVIVGGGREVTINIEIDLMGCSKSLVGVTEGDSNPKLFIPELLEHYRAGRLPFDKLITYYDFTDIGKAMDDVHSGKVIKAVLKMD